MPRSVQRVACRSFGDGWAFSHLSVQLARYSGDGRGYVKVRATGIAARRGISHAAQEQPGVSARRGVEYISHGLMHADHDGLYALRCVLYGSCGGRMVYVSRMLRVVWRSLHAAFTPHERAGPLEQRKS